MATGFPFDPDPALQARIEAVIPEIAALLGPEPGYWSAKSEADEELAEDLAADRIWRALADDLDLLYLSEELSDDEWAAWADRAANTGDAQWDILVADPIDGSSEWNRTGWRHSPVITAAMVLRVGVSGGCTGTLRAATIGFLWQETTYGIAAGQLTVHTWEQPDDHRALRVSEAKQLLSLSEAMVAAYSPTARHIEVARPLYDAAPYVHNIGGMAYSLRVVQGESERTYAASIEPIPSAIWEHAGPALAVLGGAAISRLDGSPMTLDPFIRQTSVVAANERLLAEIADACRNCTVGRSPVHVVPLSQVFGNPETG